MEATAWGSKVEREVYSLSIGPLVVPVYGLYLESYKVIPPPKKKKLLRGLGIGQSPELLVPHSVADSVSGNACFGALGKVLSSA